MKKVFFWIGLLWGCNVSMAAAQQALATAGGNATGSGGTVSYTIGQTFFTEVTGTTGSVEQGVQHAYEIYPVSTNHPLDPVCAVSVFPNPTVDVLHLDIEASDFTTMRYQLLDAAGKLLESRTIVAPRTTIMMERFSSDVYFMEVFLDNNHSKSFKIIKNK
jgi:hypothetical protein